MKTAYRLSAVAAYIAMMLTVSAIDSGSMGLASGIPTALIALFIGTLCAWLGGMFRA